MDLDPGLAQQQLHQEGGTGRPIFRSQRDPSLVSPFLPDDALFESAWSAYRLALNGCSVGMAVFVDVALGEGVLVSVGDGVAVYVGVLVGVAVNVAVGVGVDAGCWIAR